MRPSYRPPPVRPPSLSASFADSPPMRADETFGFAPYWTLDQAATFDVARLDTIAYFALGVNADGTIQQYGTGWDGYESQAFSNLVTWVAVTDKHGDHDVADHVLVDRVLVHHDDEHDQRSAGVPLRGRRREPSVVLRRWPATGCRQAPRSSSGR